MEFLYSENEDYTFMNMENYEQLSLGKNVLGDAVDYLIPNLQITVEFFDGKPVGIELPQTVELTVVETEPGLKSATASSVTKPAKTETGLVVQVPPFINEGEKIRVDTSEGAYLSRAQANDLTQLPGARPGSGSRFAGLWNAKRNCSASWAGCATTTMAMWKCWPPGLPSSWPACGNACSWDHARLASTRWKSLKGSR